MNLGNLLGELASGSRQNLPFRIFLPRESQEESFVAHQLRRPEALHRPGENTRLIHKRRDSKYVYNEQRARNYDKEGSRLPVGMAVSRKMTISTRRLAERPSGVALLSRGRSPPYPVAEKRSERN